MIFAAVIAILPLGAQAFLQNPPKRRIPCKTPEKRRIMLFGLEAAFRNMRALQRIASERLALITCWAFIVAPGLLRAILSITRILNFPRMSEQQLSQA
jgi:hypothetical protein